MNTISIIYLLIREVYNIDMIFDRSAVNSQEQNRINTSQHSERERLYVVFIL
jgi:hypothetical protein